MLVLNSFVKTQLHPKELAEYHSKPQSFTQDSSHKGLLIRAQPESSFTPHLNKKLSQTASKLFSGNIIRLYDTPIDLVQTPHYRVSFQKY